MCLNLRSKHQTVCKSRYLYSALSILPVLLQRDTMAVAPAGRPEFEQRTGEFECVVKSSTARSNDSRLLFVSFAYISTFSATTAGGGITSALVELTRILSLQQKQQVVVRAQEAVTGTSKAALFTPQLVATPVPLCFDEWTSHRDASWRKTSTCSSRQTRSSR